MIRFVGTAAAGLLMDKELKYLGMATTNPARPCIAILGGAKVSDKIEVIENLGKIVDRLLIGGAMAYTFLKAQGLPTGKSLVEEDKVELAGKLLAELGAKLMLPVDHVVVSEIAAGAANEVVDRIPEGKIAVDIGPKTIAAFAQVIAGAKTVIWNGPMGIFEKPPFDNGTVALAKAVAAPARLGGGRRRFGKGHQSRGRDRQDFARLDGGRSIAGISGGDQAAGSGGAGALGLGANALWRPVQDVVEHVGTLNRDALLEGHLHHHLKVPGNSPDGVRKRRTSSLARKGSVSHSAAARVSDEAFPAITSNSPTPERPGVRLMSAWVSPSDGFSGTR